MKVAKRDLRMIMIPCESFLFDVATALVNFDDSRDFGVATMEKYQDLDGRSKSEVGMPASLASEGVAWWSSFLVRFDFWRGFTDGAFPQFVDVFAAEEVEMLLRKLTKPIRSIDFDQ